MPQID
ncbi:hypothetical protein D043_4039, partial [Vibrio parahaemolyticus EKP-021]